jgi:ribosomal protein S18 acetylase RimI-like enzyme
MCIDVQIRPAALDDADALSLVGSATFLESFAGVLRGSDIVAHCRWQHAPEQYARWLADSAYKIWVAAAELGGASIGYLVLGPADLPLSDLSADDWEVKRVYVLRRYQGAGLGRTLLQRAQHEAQRRGGRRLLLGVYSRNEAALAFYKHVGFTIIGTRTFRVGEHDYDDWVLGMKLGD